MAPTYTVDNKLLTIKDLAILQRSAKQGLDLDSILPILNRVVITTDGSRAEDLPFDHLEEIISAIVTRVAPPNPT